MSRGPKDDSAFSARGAHAPSSQASSSSSSAEHRRKLEALFSGGGGGSSSLPASRTGETGGERVFSSPRKSTGRGPSEYRLRLERLRVAREVEEIQQAGDAFLARHQLPDDPDILYKLLQHPSEKVVREALGQLSSLLMQDRMNGTLMLREHLNSLANRVEEDATRSFIEGIRAQLAQKDK